MGMSKQRQSFTQVKWYQKGKAMHLKFLSKDYPIEKSYFIVSKFCLAWMGQFPETHSSALRNLNSAFHFVVLCAGVIAQFWYGFYYLKVDMQRGIDAICPALSCMVSFFKMVLICWYGKDLSAVIKHLQNLLFSERDEEKKKIASNLSATGTRLAFMVLVSGVMANIFYGFRPLITNLVRVVLGKEYLFDETPLRVMVPTVSLRLPWYPLTYGLTWYMGNVTVFSFSGVDGIFISFCLYSAALLKMLQNDIKSTFDQFENKIELSKEENQMCCEQLRKIVDRHNEVIDLIKHFTSLFMWIILIHFVTSAIVIGASIIEALLYPGYRAVVYLSFTLAVMCELYIYCHGGTAVLENSSGLGTSAYFSNWHKCDSRVKKMILMIIIRSQKPLTMAVPFFSPSLEAFTSIIRTAGSIIAVVQSVIL